MLDSLLVIFLLIVISAFFSLLEISLATARKIKLKLLADEGNINAQCVLKMRETPGTFFTVVQIGLNAVAILGGIVGNAATRLQQPLQPLHGAGARRAAQLFYLLLYHRHQLLYSVRRPDAEAHRHDRAGSGSTAHYQFDELLSASVQPAGGCSTA